MHRFTPMLTSRHLSIQRRIANIISHVLLLPTVISHLPLDAISRAHSAVRFLPSPVRALVPVAARRHFRAVDDAALRVDVVYDFLAEVSGVVAPVIWVGMEGGEGEVGGAGFESNYAVAVVAA